MTEWINGKSLTDTIAAILELMRAYGYWITLIGAWLEGLGIPVPIGYAMAIAGYLVGKGMLEFLPIWSLFVVGNIFGSVLAYFIGRTYGRRLLRHNSKLLQLFRIRNETWDQVEVWFGRYGGRSLLLAQVLSRTVRIPMLYAAGMAKLKFWEFFWYCFAGLGLWGAFWIVIGVVIEDNWSLLVKFVQVYGIVGLSIITAVMIIGYFYYLKYRRGSEHG